MSEDDATTPRGHQQQQHQSNISDNDPNNSIIGKMRSRVSNILPQTLSKWFSPVGGGDESGNRNGSLRRRRDEMQEQSENIGSRNRRHQRNNSDEIDVDDDGSTDDEGGGGGGGDGDNTDDEPEMCLPPSKKSKLNITEEYSVTNPYLASSSSFMRNRGNVISTSTPSATPSNHRRQLNLMKKDPPYMFSNPSTDEPRYLDDEEDVIDTDVLEVIPEHDEVVWEGNRTISSRRSLNIPSSLRRQTLSNVHRSTERNTSTLNINEDEIGDEEEEEEEEEEDHEDEIRGTRGVDGEENNSEIGGCRDRRDGSSSGMAITRKRRHENSDENIVVLTNGKASSNVIQGRIGEDATESESGDSQYSSSNLLQQQRLRHKISKSSRLFGAGGSGGIGSNSLSNRNTTVTGSNNNVGLNFYTHLQGKKSLFSDKNMNIKTALNSSTISLNSLNRRQSFNASLYGSTSALSDSRLLNISSPFYKGRTTYGGASAYSKYSSFSAGSSILNQPGAYRISRTPTSIRPSSSLSSLSSSNASLPTTAAQATASTSDGDVLTISNTAKRILELMNQFTTPLSDAKKMANTIKLPTTLSSLVDHKKRFNDDDLKQSRAIRMSAPTTPYSRPKPSRLLTATASNILPPPTNELHVPSMANLLQMKKLQNNIEKVREIANSSKSNLNTRGEYKLPSNVTSVSTFDTQQQQQNLDSPGTSSSSNNSNKHVSKIRSRITASTRHSNASARKAINEDEPLPPVNLPEISLPFMKSVPKIDITIPKSNQNQPQPISKVHTTGTATTTNTISSQSSYNNKSIIASTAPKETSSVGIENYSKSNSSTPNMIHEFKFSMPLEIAKNSTLKDQQNTVESVDKFNFSKPIALDINSSATELVATINKPHSTAFENFKFQSPISKMDEATQKVEIATKSTLPAVPQQLKTGSVLDVLKKKQNQTSSTAASSVSTITTVTDSTAVKGFGDQFKMPKNQWECQICMIPNNNNLDKCAACQTPRKDINTSTNNNTITASVSSAVVKNSFGDMFKPKADSWECSECMLINKNELNECAACKASKPGSSKSGDKLSFSVSSSSSNQSIFSVPNKLSTAGSATQQDASFKNLIAQQSSKWECPACMTRNEQTRSKCVCCEQEKPGSIKSNNSNVQKPNLFGFGAATTSKFSFGFNAAQKEDDLKKKDTEHSTATVTSSSNNSEKDKIGTTETNSSNKTGFSFGSSMVSSSTLNTSQNTASKPPLTFGFKPTSSTLETASGKDVPDVSTSSNFKFGTVSTQKSGTQETTQSSSTATEKKTFTFGINKPVDHDTKLNTEKTLKFGSPVTATSAGSSIDKPQDKSATESKSEISKQSIFGTPASLGESKIGSASSSSSTPTIFGSSSTSFVTQKPDSTADSSQKNLFKFGESSMNKTDKNAVEGDSNKKLNFSFGSTDNTGAATSTPPKIPAFTSAFSSPNAQKTVANDIEPNKPLFGTPATPTSTAISTSVSTPTTTSSLFAFGKPSTVTTSPFVAAGTNTNNGRTSVTSTNTTTNTPIFGSLPTTTVATTSTTSIFGSQSNPTFGNASSLLQSQQQGQQQQTGSIFGSNFSCSASNNNSSLQSSGVSQQPNNLFTFGSSIPPKTDNSTNSGGSIFGSVSSTTTTNKPFTFGSNQTTTPTTTTQASSSSFVFGSASSLQKPSEGTSLFGSGSSSAFSAPAATTINSSQQQQQQQQKSETKPTFGSKQQQTLTPFGNNSTGVSSSSNIPAFGSNPSAGTSIFGSAAPTFGSTGFGIAGNTTFGNTAAVVGAPPTFGSSTFGNIGDSNLTKKPESTPAFNFSGAQSTSSSGLFTFGANNNNNNNNNNSQQQSPFAFSASSAPSFNFSGSQETNTSFISYNSSSSTKKNETASNTTTVGHQIRQWLKVKQQHQQNKGDMIKIINNNNNHNNDNSNNTTSYNLNKNILISTKTGTTRTALTTITSQAEQTTETSSLLLVSPSSLSSLSLLSSLNYERYDDDGNIRDDNEYIESKDSNQLFKNRNNEKEITYMTKLTLQQQQQQQQINTEQQTNDENLLMNYNREKNAFYKKLNNTIINNNDNNLHEIITNTNKNIEINIEPRKKSIFIDLLNRNDAKFYKKINLPSSSSASTSSSSASSSFLLDDEKTTITSAPAAKSIINNNNNNKISPIVTNKINSIKKSIKNHSNIVSKMKFVKATTTATTTTNTNTTQRKLYLNLNLKNRNNKIIVNKNRNCNNNNKLANIIKTRYKLIRKQQKNNNNNDDRNSSFVQSSTSLSLSDIKSEESNNDNKNLNIRQNYCVNDNDKRMQKYKKKIIMVSSERKNSKIKNHSGKIVKIIKYDRSKYKYVKPIDTEKK